MKARQQIAKAKQNWTALRVAEALTNISSTEIVMMRLDLKNPNGYDSEIRVKVACVLTFLYGDSWALYGWPDTVKYEGSPEEIALKIARSI